MSILVGKNTRLLVQGITGSAKLGCHSLCGRVHAVVALTGHVTRIPSLDSPARLAGAQDGRPQYGSPLFVHP